MDFSSLEGAFSLSTHSRLEGAERSQRMLRRPMAEWPLPTPLEKCIKRNATVCFFLCWSHSFKRIRQTHLTLQVCRTFLLQLTDISIAFGISYAAKLLNPLSIIVQPVELLQN